MWVLVVVLLVALMIPITAILLDSPLGRSFARRLEGQGDGGGAGSGAGVRKLEERVEALESDQIGRASCRERVEGAVGAVGREKKEAGMCERGKWVRQNAMTQRVCGRLGD